jgi:hypothetical protein
LTNEIVNISIEDVLYVPDLQYSLLSVPQMEKQGIVIHFETDNNYLSTKDKAYKVQIHYLSRLPSLEIKSVTDYSYAVGDDLMHARMCHLHIGSCKHGFCNACALGKAHDATYSRKSRQLSKRKVTKPGQLIHTDVAGPFPKSIVNGNRYTCVFLDDFSERKFVYYMKTKGQTVEALEWLQTQLKRANVEIGSIR